MEDWALARRNMPFRFAIDEGVNVSPGAADASRTDVIFLRRVRSCLGFRARRKFLREHTESLQQKNGCVYADFARAFF